MRVYMTLSFKFHNKLIMTLKITKTEILFKKLLYIRMSILDLSTVHTSEYPPDKRFNIKVLGLMKDETEGKIMAH